MEVVLASLVPSHNYVPRRFLAAAWPSLGMRNPGGSDVQGLLADKLKQAIPSFFQNSLRISLMR